jgi:hypothetical protein
MRNTGVVVALSMAISIAAFVAPSALFGAGPEVTCTMRYQPVCAARQAQCIKAPCYPVYQTYDNACSASAAGAKVIHDGACMSQETGLVVGPKAALQLGNSTIARVTSPVDSPSTSTTVPILLMSQLASRGTSSARLDADWFQDLFEQCLDAVKWIRARMLITVTE